MKAIAFNAKANACLTKAIAFTGKARSYHYRFMFEEEENIALIDLP